MFGTRVIVTGQVSAISSRLAAHRTGHELLEKRADPWANVPGVASEASPRALLGSVHQKATLLRFLLRSPCRRFPSGTLLEREGASSIKLGQEHSKIGVLVVIDKFQQTGRQTLLLVCSSKILRPEVLLLRGANAVFGTSAATQIGCTFCL